MFMPKDSKTNHPRISSVRYWRGLRSGFHNIATILACLLTWAWLIVACTAVKTPLLLKQLERAEHTWANQRITDYRIEISDVHSIWHVQSYRIIVTDGQVADVQAWCVVSPFEAGTGTCEVQAYKAEDYLVPGLFSRARSELQGPQAAWIEITYDPKYGFPAAIYSDDPDALDDEWSLRVTSFEVIR